jgi:hypothetical protein
VAEVKKGTWNDPAISSTVLAATIVYWIRFSSFIGTFIAGDRGVQSEKSVTFIYPMVKITINSYSHPCWAACNPASIQLKIDNDNAATGPKKATLAVWAVVAARIVYRIRVLNSLSSAWWEELAERSAVHIFSGILPTDTLLCVLRAVWITSYVQEKTSTNVLHPN